MDFKDKLQQLAERIENFKEKILTEEATKNAFIMPFIQLLGYDVFNPCEVIPEWNCDIVKDKGEKIDYAIMQNDKPIMVIECKHWKQNLDNHCNQLQRYFVSAIDAKFGILTNGIIYRIYTDLENTNIMDSTPFFELDLLNLKDDAIKDLKKFSKEQFNVESIKATASETKYLSLFKERLRQQLTEPSWDFVRFLSKNFYEKKMTTPAYEKFKEYTKQAFNIYLNEIISDAINNRDKIEDTKIVEKDEQQNKIVTTIEELEAFYIIKSILRDIAPANEILYKDYQSYFTIFLKGYKVVCRLYFYQNLKVVGIVNIKDKTEKKYTIQSLDDIYQYKQQFLDACK